jgi:hypothetical protein
MTVSIVSTDNTPLHLNLLYALEDAIADPEVCRFTLVRELTALLDWFNGRFVSEEVMAELVSENAIQTLAMTLQDRRIPSGNTTLIKAGFYIVSNLLTRTSPCSMEQQDHRICFFKAMGGLGGFVGLLKHHQTCPTCSSNILFMLSNLYRWDVIEQGELFGTHWEELVALVEDALEMHLDMIPVTFLCFMMLLLRFPLLLRSLDRRVAPYIHQSLVEYNNMECPLCVMMGQKVIEGIIGSSLLAKSLVACPCCAGGGEVTCSAAA